jgi:hypothetical protein
VNAGMNIRLQALRDSSVGIMTRYGLDCPGIESRCGRYFPAPVQTGPVAHPASCTIGTGSFPGVKRPGRGVEYSLLSSAEDTCEYLCCLVYICVVLCISVLSCVYLCCLVYICVVVGISVLCVGL